MPIPPHEKTCAQSCYCEIHNPYSFFVDIFANMTDDYKCTLDEKYLKKAKDELHEDPKNRLGAVETFRKWIIDQPHITCPTGNKAYSHQIFLILKFGLFFVRK